MFFTSPIGLAFVSGSRSSPSRSSPKQLISTRAVVRHACLKEGDMVMVAGAVGLTGRIVVSMLQEANYVARPIIGASTDNAALFGLDVEGFLADGSEELPDVAGFLVADERGLDGALVADFVSQLASEGALKRVALLSSRPKANPLGMLLGGGGGGEKRKALEAATISACAQAGVECTVVRSGELRGGGPSTNSSHCIANYYLTILDSIAQLEEELFDVKQRGFVIQDTVESGNIFSSAPETSRITAAAAMVQSLAAPSAANKLLQIVSAESDEHPTAAEWDAAFSTAPAYG